MEENNKGTNKKLSYEELEKLTVQLNNRLIQAENQLNSIDYTTLRLNYLFKVLENSRHFAQNYINKTSEEIVNLLRIEDNTATVETKE